MTSIQPRAAREYVDNPDATCPFCGSENIEGDSFNCEAGRAWQRVRCCDCELDWSDIYRLAGYSFQDGDVYHEEMLPPARAIVRVTGGVAEGSATESVELLIVDYDTGGDFALGTVVDWGAADDELWNAAKATEDGA